MGCLGQIMTTIAISVQAVFTVILVLYVIRQTSFAKYMAFLAHLERNSSVILKNIEIIEELNKKAHKDDKDTEFILETYEMTKKISDDSELVRRNLGKLLKKKKILKQPPDTTSHK